VAPTLCILNFCLRILSKNFSIYRPFKWGFRTSKGSLNSPLITWTSTHPSQTRRTQIKKTKNAKSSSPFNSHHTFKSKTWTNRPFLINSQNFKFQPNHFTLQVKRLKTPKSKKLSTNHKWGQLMINRLMHPLGLLTTVKTTKAKFRWILFKTHLAYTQLITYKAFLILLTTNPQWNCHWVMVQMN